MEGKELKKDGEPYIWLFNRGKEVVAKEKTPDNVKSKPVWFHDGSDINVRQLPKTNGTSSKVSKLISKLFCQMSASLDSTPQTEKPCGDDWQEDVYQKIKTMKENYLPQLNEMHQKIATKLHQLDSLPQQPKSDTIEKLKVFQMMLGRLITFVQVSKSNISLGYKEKLDSYEKQIINFINTNKPRQTMPSLQQVQGQGQLPPSDMQTQIQVTQEQSHENQMNSQLQANIQGSVAEMQHNSLSSVSAAPQSRVNTTAAANFPTSSPACIRMRVSEIAQAMIDRRLTIQPDTEGWQLAQELLSLARPPSTSGQRRKRTRTTQ